MSKVQDSLPDGGSEPASLDPRPDHASGAVTMVRGEAWEEHGTNGTGSAGHTLLSRPAALQGRRSLFRR